MSRWMIALALLAIVAGGCSDDDGGDNPTAPDGNVRVFIIDPLHEEVWTAVNDTLTLTATVADETEVLPGTAVSWSSDRDGSLGTATANASGQASLSGVLLSAGDHTIRAVVGNPRFVQARDEALVHHILPARVSVVAAEASIDGVSLRFTANRESRFQHYELRRWVDDQTFEQSEHVVTIAAREDTNVVDPLPPVHEQVHYTVVVRD